MSGDINRRDFVKSAAAVGAVAAMAGVAGCAPASQSLSSSVAAAGAKSSASSTGSASPSSEASAVSRVKVDNSTPDGSKVFYTDDISASGLLAVYQALGFKPSGKVAVKLHMGEEGNSNYLDPELLRPLVELTDDEFASLEAALDECVVYGHRGLGGF